MDPVLYELMWTAHRAECDAAVEGGVTGPLPDLRSEEIIEATPVTIHSFNLGVANGIKFMLTHLHEAGYVLHDPQGAVITPGPHTDLGEAFAHWLVTPSETK